MMKNRIPPLVFLIFMVPPSILWGTHTGFTESAISTTVDGAYSVYAADVPEVGDPPGFPTVP